MRFFFRKLNIYSSCTAKQSAPINIRNNVLLNKIHCFIADLITNPFHILAVTVNRLRRTAQLGRNTFNIYACDFRQNKTGIL